MPPPPKDYPALASALERKLTFLQEGIIGIAASGKSAVENPEQISLFKVKLESACEDWKQFCESWEQRIDLREKITDDVFPSQSWTKTYRELKDEVLVGKACLLDINSAGSPAQASAADLTQLVTTLTERGGGKGHLPKISIPHFYGDLLKWSHFKDTFISLVHSSDALSDVEKFHYLLSALKGEAASLLARFPVEERSYAQAWEKLLQAYDNPRVLANCFVQRILDCELGSSKGEMNKLETFITEVADSIEAFKGLNLKDPAEFLLSNLALRTLDPYTRKQFEIARDATKPFPTTGEVIGFVRQRLTALKLSCDTSDGKKSPTPKAYPSNSSRTFPKRSSYKHKVVSLHTTSQGFECPSSESRKLPQSSTFSSRQHNTRSTPKAKPICAYCKEHHHTAYCAGFDRLSLSDRLSFVNGRKICRNCLQEGHTPSGCPSKYSCRVCKKKHHTKLHEDPRQQDAQTGTSAQSKKKEPGTFTGFGSSPDPEGRVLLGTVEVLVKGHGGRSRRVRAVMDCGSQHSFITTSIARELGLPLSKFDGHVKGLGDTALSTPVGSLQCVITPLNASEEFSTKAIVVDRISTALPSSPIPPDKTCRLKHLPLADCSFDSPSPVDLLIGCNLYYDLIRGIPYKAEVDHLFLVPTVFGLLVTGEFEDDHQDDSCAFLTEDSNDLHERLAAFWELEEPCQKIKGNSLDEYCEAHFVETHSRTAEGRYIVQLPMAQDSPPIGDNRQMAKRRFFSLEGKFRKDPGLRGKYKEFMREYTELNHMTPATSEAKYIIPHHAVWQDRPEGPKLRVVFDASCRSSSGSLNDILLAGPKLQSDLSVVLMQFRMYRIPLCADLVKMYRQILVHPSQRHLQHILWREDPSARLQEYELNTVTYGLKPSAYLAMRVLKQLIIDEGDNFPLASAHVARSMYVDDLVTGADTIEDALALKEELCGLFKKGGFTLGKWASNVKELVPESENQDSVSLQGKEEENFVKILGLVWNPKEDVFSYTVKPPPAAHATKRSVLSFIARIFDPLGFLAPAVFHAKVLLQSIWKENLNWDDTLTPELLSAWKALIIQWDALSEVKIPRYITSIGAAHSLVGFSDASFRGYAAAVYLVSEEPNSQKKRVSLVKAKTKVAPLKYISIARLELCGALLLARVMATVKQANLDYREVICYTDSQVALSWIQTPQHELKIFEANRVAEISELTGVDCWRHVSSEDNPADVASRGCSPLDIKQCRLWWSGPPWLHEPASNWPSSSIKLRQPEHVFIATDASLVHPEAPDSWMTRFSSYETLVRTVARILRWSVLNRKSISSPITADEFRMARDRCIKSAQKAFMPKEMYTSSGPTSKEFSPLHPFIDECGIVRVGGRLSNAPLKYSSRHPALIPRESHLAKLIVDHFHQTHYHSGPTLTLALIRGQFWIPGGLKYVRGRIIRCVKCRIKKAKPADSLMAPLPKARFSQYRSFIQVGTDFAGPFQIKESTRRNAALGKAYLCVFICMSSRAMHIETVSSLSTEAFLAALDRFIARRGLPKKIHSDNGTNFVGASRFIKDVYSFLAQNEKCITEFLSPKGIEWSFIPPHAPHFGGIWEAGVKSAKTLLANSVGKTPFTFEELTTILTKVEGFLNSRPLCPLGEDVESYDVLTPGHFLIGAPLACVPEEPIEELHKSFSSRWGRVQHQINHIWSRWRKEYLHLLLQRSKWRRAVPPLKVGDLVILEETRSLVGHWLVARVIETHPGGDGVTRVVTIRLPSGKEFVRPAKVLVPLFFDED